MQRVTAFTAMAGAPCYVGTMKTTYDPRPAPLGPVARFIVDALERLLAFLVRLPR